MGADLAPGRPDGAGQDSPLLSVRNLMVRFAVQGGLLLRKIAEIRAVDDVSFDVAAGETLGLVGESGCGKTTVGRAIVNILSAMSPGVGVEGRVVYNGDPRGPVDLLGLGRRAMRTYRSQVQMVFQDPYSSLNPRMTVGETIDEPLRIHTRDDARTRRARVISLLERVGLAADHVTRYPHEFSGGQRQRIGIARALATNPRVVIADEPVSALDVSIQAQVVNLMQDLQEELGLSYIFIAHDLSVVRHVSNRIAVMYLGSLVEIGPADAVYLEPLHPYSRALLSAVPQPDPDGTRPDRVRLGGEVPSPRDKPSGCGFRTRCPIARPSCADAPPPFVQHDDRFVACPWV